MKRLSVKSLTSQKRCLLNTRTVLIDMEGAGSPVYWLGTTTRFASMIYQNGHLTFRWETNRDAMEEIWEGCILYPNKPIADLEDQKRLQDSN